MKAIIGVLIALLVGCATEYKAAPQGDNEVYDRALAACRADGAGYSGGGGLIGILTYQNFMNDCMRAKGYVPKS